MADDIITTIPWTCGFCDDCKVGWHLANYWIYDDGTYSIDKYSDGDHDACEQAEVPSADDEQKAWREYYEYVVTTGLDPVSQFHLPALNKKPHSWQAKIRNSIGSTKDGLRVTGVRRRGRGPWIPLDGERYEYDHTDDSMKLHSKHRIPTEVYDYLFLGHQDYKWGSRDWKSCHAGIGPDLNTWDKLREAVGDKLKMHKHFGTLDFSVDEAPAEWSDDRISAWLKKQARKALRD
jgi:hypothetical protein